MVFCQINEVLINGDNILLNQLVDLFIINAITSQSNIVQYEFNSFSNTTTHLKF